jgi:hypothetical protein
VAAWLLAGLGPGCVVASRVAAEPLPSPTPAAFFDSASERRVRAEISRPPAEAQPGLRAALRRPQAPAGLLRFEEQVDVAARTPRSAVAEAFAGQDLLHGPTFASAPTVAESRGPARFDANPESPSLDLLSAGLAGALALVKKLRGPGEPRYFLYEARLADGSARLLLREGRMPPEGLEAPGVSYRELASFARFEDAQRAQAALEAAWPARLRAAPAP